MDVVRTHTLKHPIIRTIKDSKGERQEKVTVVNFRKPFGRDMLAMDKVDGDTAKMFAFVSYISDVSVAEIENMEIVDVRALMKIGNDFLFGGRATGETASDASPSSEE